MRILSVLHGLLFVLSAALAGHHASQGEHLFLVLGLLIAGVNLRLCVLRAAEARS